MQKDILLGLLRHVLTTAGGVLVSKGYLDAAGLETIIGGVLTLAGVAWSIQQKRTALAVPPTNQPTNPPSETKSGM